MRSRQSNPAGGAGRGQAMVELALIAPAMLLVMLLAVDFGRLFFSYVAVSNAAREGAFYAATHAADPGYSQAAFEAGVVQAAVSEGNVQAQGGEGSLSVSHSDPTVKYRNAPGGAFQVRRHRRGRTPPLGFAATRPTTGDDSAGPDPHGSLAAPAMLETPTAGSPPCFSCCFR